MAAVAGGSKQAIIVVNDNSAGNDAIICDKSITSVADMKGKTVAAEEGVVDHFLLLQGLAKAGMTQDDIDFRGVLTADAAASFSGGQFDCVGVFAPFTLEALKRPGSHVVFSSKDFPGTHPGPHRGVADDGGEAAEGRAEARERLVRHARLHRGEPRQGARRSWPTRPSSRPPTTQDLAKRHEDLHRRRGARGVPARRPRPTSLEYTAELINPFLVKSGLTKKQASLKGLFAPQFTQAYADRPSVVVTASAARLT